MKETFKTLSLPIGINLRRFCSVSPKAFGCPREKGRGCGLCRPYPRVGRKVSTIGIDRDRMELEKNRRKTAKFPLFHREKRGENRVKRASKRRKTGIWRLRRCFT